MNTFEIPTSIQAYNLALALAWIDNNRTIEEYKRRKIPMPVSYMRYSLGIVREFTEAMQTHYGDSDNLTEALHFITNAQAALERLAMPQAAYEAADGGLSEVRR